MFAQLIRANIVNFPPELYLDVLSSARWESVRGREQEFVRASIRVIEECQRVSVRQMCIAERVPHEFGGKSRAAGSSAGKNSTVQSQSFSSSQYGSKSSLSFD